MSINIIPLPNYYKYREGKFDAVNYSVSGEFDFAVKYLSDLLGDRLVPCGTENSVDIHIMNNSKFLNTFFDEIDELVDSSYVIDISKKGITVAARADVGAFYAAQSLRQYMELDTIPSGEPLDIPFIEIRDIPYKKWRGYMLDISRHFFSVTEIKRQIELMSMIKINKFHIHLSDDQGFRLDIKKYPKLKEIGSKRKDSQIGGWNGKTTEGEPHEGSLSETDVADLVEYASARGVEIIPEIDLPGHTMALVSAYPEAACSPEPKEVFAHFGRSYDLVCAGKEKAFEIVFGILDEIARLFPSKYIHIGGDEAPKDVWEKCPDCNKRMKDENLANAEMLQGYVTNRICEHLSAIGKVVIVWNEALTDNLLPVKPGQPCKIIGQYWVGDGKVAKQNAINGREIISSLNSSNYLDYTYASIPLKKIYNYNPMPAGLSMSHEKRVIGIEAPLWTEWVCDEAKIDFNTYPRLCAVAENAWTYPEMKNYSDFETRINYYYLKILDKLKVNYAPKKTYRGGGLFSKSKIMKDWSIGSQYMELDLSDRNINRIALPRKK